MNTPSPLRFLAGLRLDIKGVTILMISGTASIDEYGKTIHIGDFRAQTGSEHFSTLQPY